MHHLAHVGLIAQVVQQKPIEAYRNTFANLALPLFAMAEPIPSKSFEYKELKWSIWDRWILEGDLTVQVCCCQGVFWCQHGFINLESFSCT